MATFTELGIDNATKNRILNFLNSAINAVAIAGVEPQKGPVLDDPSTGYGDQIDDYDIGLTVAQRIIDKRNTFSGNTFTSLAQLSNINGLGQDKFNDLVYSFGPAIYGQWDQLADSPVYAVHAALLKSGKVLMFAGGAESGYPLDSATYDPVSNSYNVQTGNDAYSDDLFCSHHAALADGTMVVNGGADGHPHAHGIKKTYYFDPNLEKWFVKEDMDLARWYPTTLALPDSKLITFSGFNAVGSITPQVEDFDPSSGTIGDWSTRTQATANKTLQTYPGMHLMPNGKILYTGTRWASGVGIWGGPTKTALFDLNTNTWADVGDHIVKDRTEGMSVILPPDNNRVMIIGGRGDHATNKSTNSVEIIDFNDATPAWQSVSPMNFPRRNVNAVLLPTQKVLVCSGIQGFKWDSNPLPVLTAEEYDPVTNSWTQLADMAVARQYHSCSILLPDGRVLNLGSVKSDGTGHNLIKKVEVFSPPYLFNGARPVISNAPSIGHHGENITIDTTQANDIGSVVLVKPMAITHHTDSEQRVIPLSFSVLSSNQIQATMPNGSHPHYHAIRAQYMLFILTNNKVPSEAKFIELH